MLTNNNNLSVATNKSNNNITTLPITPFNSYAEGTTFQVANSMTPIYSTSDGTTIAVEWGEDTGTKERKLLLAVVYADGEVSPIREYNPSKLVSPGRDKPPAVLKELADLAGLKTSDVQPIYLAYKAFSKTKGAIKIQNTSGEKCSLQQAHRELTEYVCQYMEPDKVFVHEGYGNIDYTYMPTVLSTLLLGYSRLELSKNFQAWGLLRTNAGTGHAYTYKIKRKWYFSFRLADMAGETGGDVE